MSFDSVFAFWVVALMLIAVPGADWAFTIAAGLSGRSVVPAVGGLVLGYTAMTLVVAAGVGALVAKTPAALTVLTLVGGAYLVWHGAMTMARPSTPDATTDVAYRADWEILVKGVGVSGLNPKGLLLFIALLPQFTSPRGSWPVAVQIGILGLVFTATCAGFYFSLGSFARTIMHARPAFARTVGRLSGAAMVGLGTYLFADRLIF